MQCPLCDSTDVEIIGKTANGDRKYSCHICNNIFVNDNSNTFVLPTINFLRFKNKPFFQLLFNRITNRVLNFKNQILDLDNQLTDQENQTENQTEKQSENQTKILTRFSNQGLNPKELLRLEKQARFKKRILIGLRNQLLTLKDIITSVIEGKNQEFKINKVGIAEILAVFGLWLISLIMSSYVFNRPLDLDAHHEFITAHTLVSLRSFDQWGIFQTLGASILVPKSNEYLQVDITVLGKDNGVYLSYPSLWLVLPYLIFKILAIPITIANLQIYHLIFNRLFTSVIIYFLFLEIIYLFKDNLKKINQKTDFVQGWGAKLLAFLGTAAWIFSPPVLYWSQNVYFCDQAILLPVYALLLFAIKQRFQFHNLSYFKKLILFAISLLTAGFDWYGWVVLFLLMLIVVLPLISKNINKKTNKNFTKNITTALISIQPIVAAIALISSWFIAQLIYYKDGYRQITATAFARSGGQVPLDIGQDLFVMSSYWGYYLPKFLKPFWDDGRLSIMSMSIGLLILLSWLLWHCQRKLSLLAIFILIFIAPLTQIAILRQHSTIHDFSAFKLALPTVFTIWIVIPMSILILLEYLPRIFSYLAWLGLGILVTLSIYANTNNTEEFIEFAGSGSSYPSEIGVIIQKYIANDDLPISDSNGISVRSIPPQPTWYANRFIYGSAEIFDFSRRVNMPNLKNLNPVFMIFANEPVGQPIQSLCQDSWETIPETIGGRKVSLCRNKKLKELY
jgi:Na+-transporting methylmalonyl-CoA/oxaloacetate decarboxylase gamma subunit